MEDFTLRAHLGALRAPGPGAGLPARGAQGDSFADALSRAIGEVNDLQKEADRKAEDLATGRDADIHGTMIALERGDIAFRVMAQVRNKLLEAYQEVMRMQV
jgi:flagellar hook-basal body complex protein FliE